MTYEVVPGPGGVGQVRHRANRKAGQPLVYLATLFLISIATTASIASPALFETQPLSDDLLESSYVTLLSEDGDQNGLSEIIGEEPAVLHFWATWCAPCREELPDVADFTEWLKDQNHSGQMLVVSVDQKSFEKVRLFLDEDLGLTKLETHLGDGLAIGTAFKILGYPSTVIIDPKAELIGQHTGPIDWTDSEVRHRLLTYLGGSRD